jgi:hypothetical protein
VVRVLVVRALALFALLPVAAVAGAPAEHDRVVLVASAASPATSLDAIDLKRLFFGVPVVAGGRNLHALLNDSDSRLVQIFLQHVVGMSHPIYERRLLQLTMQQGRAMPRSLDSDDKLISALLADPTAVSYAWASSVEADRRLRVVRELWRE